VLLYFESVFYKTALIKLASQFVKQDLYEMIRNKAHHKAPQITPRHIKNEPIAIHPKSGRVVVIGKTET
jgi:hypothetical protein